MRNKKNVIFMGTPDFAVPSLEKIHKEYHVLSVYTQPPKKSGRGLRTKLNPIHEISNDYNLPVKTPQNFKSFDIVKEIGFKKTENIEEANCYVLNTCHIRDKAKEKVYHEIGRVRQIF